MERLSLILPSFRRLGWSNAKAKEAWEPRISRIIAAWYDIEWLSVAVGMRECAMLSPAFYAIADPLERWGKHKLSDLLLPTHSDSHHVSVHCPMHGVTVTTIA